MNIRIKNPAFFFFFAFILALGVDSANGQAFVDKGYSARTTSLGRSVVATTGDPNLIFYNPAGIATSERVTVYSSYTNLFPSVSDGSLNYLAFSGVYPVTGIGVAGLGITQFSPSGWAENVVVGSFATKFLSDNLSVGGSVKYLHWKSESPQGEYAVPEPGISYSGISVDAGVSFLIPDVLKDNDIRFGVSLQDINRPSVAANGSKDAKLPFGLTGGVSYLSRTYNYILTAQVSHRGDGLDIAGGAELLGLRSNVFGAEGKFLVRAGGSTGLNGGKQVRGEYDAGFGIVIGGVAIDYAYVLQAVLTNIGGINTVSVGYTF